MLIVPCNQTEIQNTSVKSNMKRDPGMASNATFPSTCIMETNNLYDFYDGIVN